MARDDITHCLAVAKLFHISHSSLVLSATFSRDDRRITDDQGLDDCSLQVVFLAENTLSELTLVILDERRREVSDLKNPPCRDPLVSTIYQESIDS